MAQYTADSIFSLSKKFYENINTGRFTVLRTFKSSIAESYSTDNFEIVFWKKTMSFQSISGNSEVVLAGEHYYLVDRSNKRYIDLSKEQDLKEQNIKLLEEYPNFNPSFFDHEASVKFSVKTKGDTLLVSNPFTYYYFSAADFSLLRFRSTIPSEYGLQIKDWTITNPRYKDKNMDKRVDLSFLKTFEKVTSFDQANKIPDLKGTFFRNSIRDSVWSSSDGTPVSLDSLSGKYVLLDFFYQSCMPCIMSFKYLQELHLVNNPGKELVIIGIDPAPQDSSSMEKFKKRYKLKYDIITMPFAGPVKAVFNPAGMYPYYVLVDPKGEIIEIQEGYSEEFFRKVKEIISK